MTTDSSRELSGTPFAVRLKAARKMAGLSMEDLAKKLGGMVTKQAIGKYEKGQMMPTPEVLERLIDVLHIATWGASPLRMNTNEMADMCLYKDATPLIRLEANQLPLLRRHGLLRRLKKDKRPEGADVEMKEISFIVDKQFLAPRIPNNNMASPSKHISLPQEAGLATLADRRRRYLRAWESDAALNQIRFREGERLSSKTESALKYRIADHLQRYLEVESVLNSVSAFENPVANLPVRTSGEVEAAAAEVRRRWELGSGPIVNVLGLFEDKGVKVYETRGIAGFEGLSGRFGDVPFVAVSMDYPPDRVRFTAAHELGHMLCDFSTNESPESMCHAFGAAFLLPKSALEKALAPSRRKVTMGELGEIKETFGISIQAIMYRAHSLELVSDRQLRSFRETLKAKGWVTEEPVAYTGKERATRFRRLLHYAVAADILDADRAAAIAGISPNELKKEIGDIF
jgi:Zn-dependent peptidase ImmA (M78 family)/transcriptional regulator with XRE-family HTH domain